MNRYYSSGFGRYFNAGSVQGEWRPNDPQSWNRYAYVENVPVNYYDESALYSSPTGSGPGGSGGFSSFRSPMPNPGTVCNQLWYQMAAGTVGYGLIDFQSVMAQCLWRTTG